MSKQGRVSLVALVLLGLLGGGLALVWRRTGQQSQAPQGKTAASQEESVTALRESTSQGPAQTKIPAAGLLPVRSIIPSFRFTDQNGQALGLADLRGKVWLADFIFLHCQGPCPAMTVTMKGIQDRTQDLPGLQLVSFTVDPDRDTLPELKKYAQNTDADPKRWHFLRGPKATLRHLLQKGFLLGTPANTLNHSTRFVLVDQTGRVRGHYDFKRGDDMVRMLKDARLLLTGERQ